MSKIGVVGAGSWGMALSRMLSNRGHDVLIWSALESEIDTYSKTRIYPNLSSMAIPQKICFTKSIEEVCADKDILLFAVPSVYVRETARKAAPYIKNDQIIVDVAKGIEESTLMTMSQVIKDELKKANKQAYVVALSGPTHAEEVALDLPTTIVSACEDMDIARKVQDVFMNTCMRVYTNNDVFGVELCGALKNIIALSAGISSGLGFGDNAKAALLTRGLAEISRLGSRMGCKEHTFWGLAGIGDMIVTATSMHSRNNRCGMLIGQGVPVQEAVKEVGMVVEGINALPAAIKLMKMHQVNMPLTEAVYDVVINGADPRQVAHKLMTAAKISEHPKAE